MTIEQLPPPRWAIVAIIIAGGVCGAAIGPLIAMANRG